MSLPYASVLINDSRPFIHPSISRLRSSLPATPRQRVVSSSSLGTANILGRDLLSPSPSHFSSISRTSSTSNLRIADTVSDVGKEQEAFKWTTLRIIGEHVYHKAPDKANAILGSPVLGSPTVLAANGLICIGTDSGRVFVFDFKQELKCICGDDNSARSYGPVTALALSHDHTFVAVGHGQGHIQLFDIKQPLVAARTVVPTKLAAVRSGRQEGHLLGSRIVSLGFISGRHTAVVSADDQGLSFYHSLGRVLFMDANDCLRLLGKYPEEEPIASQQPIKRVDPQNGSAIPSPNGSATPRLAQQVHRKANAILSMGPLPLGTVEHPTDSYQLVAMLTPIKLVIVGLKPTPKTWHRRHREGEDGNNGRSRWRGCLAWFPSISTSENVVKATKKRDKRQSALQNASLPLLAYSWGSTLYILRVSESRILQTVRNEKTGKIEKVDTGKVNFEDHGLLNLRSDILAIQWLNLNQIILFTDATLEVFDIRASKVVENVAYEALNLVSPTLSYTANGAMAYQDSVRDIHHSVRVYKGKIFLLEYKEVKVGTLLSWADRILAYVQEGDFLSAINLARDYYLGQAKGNKNGLPEDVDAMHAMVGEKMSDLMVASARYAFSEDRLTDSTHVTADNRGVDRTSLFEDLVSTCARACIALDEFDFLFEDLFQYYDDSGISQIYLHQLEPFILDGSIHFIPPRITQRLVAMHDECGDYEAAERLIWHIDPDCLDINQVLTLCQKYHLYDALIYIYNSALQDYITPIVELLGMVRKVQQTRRDRMLGVSDFNHPASYDGINEENLVLNAYRIYPYLSNILSGLRYPSETPLSPEDALKAQNDVYSFLFHGRSFVWPAGGGGKLVLTADEEGGIEPTYPYARLLLRFDAEAFLHVVDIAFEQSYLNDETNGTSRQIIIKILLDIVVTSGPSLSPADVTFVNIFVARNVPKYPQFIHIAPSALQNLLIGLASDADQSTREDRQLAAEFLLSAYTPHDSEKILHLFENAGFFRILRTWYRQEGQWAALLRTYVHDPELSSEEVFPNVEQTLSHALRAGRNQLPEDVISSLQYSIPLLLQMSIPHTALLIDKYAPGMHSKVIDDFQVTDDHKRYAYLRCLLGPPLNGDESLGFTRENGPSTSVSASLQKLYLRLLCQLEPSNVIVGLEYLPTNSLDTDEIVRICEEERMYEAVVWLINEESAVESLSRLEEFSRNQTADLGEALLREEGSATVTPELEEQLAKFEALCRMGIDICREHSEQTAEADVPLEDLWFKLLSSQIDAVQAISSSISYGDGVSSCTPAEERVISSLRGLVQYSFTSLVAVSSTKAVSFPRLFKRLVDSTAHSHSQSGAKYAEFRNIITSMLESYRSEGDLLAMSKRIIDTDFFDTYEDLTKERSKGWPAASSKCLTCRKAVHPGTPVRSDPSSPPQKNSVIVSRTGVYHATCYPSNSNHA
ncbi:lateendosome to vacuole transport-family protein [Fomitiporia mediterranea MF3/22]|uniref:lateendosome to vacuole transport-family protein n=1 Tax=Fomitiporia mediterranea (strain MF3/22) TaxID=694068 RepID=UPI0004407D56|nr:lateendosome to vacuole transport-family protein [Fomitiporia mediterranea MF3/22]EJD02930.1 lateendosome to vacuole transport-family protein [Fomitiporia mediterranea MF3/22]